MSQVRMNQGSSSLAQAAPRSGAIETIQSAFSRQPAVWVVAAVVGLVHAATAGRYDAQRNELYFLVCGWHPDFGYVDQPPLVPLIAAATQVFGISTWMLRLPATLVAIGLSRDCSAAEAGRRCSPRLPRALRPASPDCRRI
jgi:hypothetical protein